ncbi:hypothetical protein [Gelidibacter maritimus]|uniref:Uncharacterized protein n=1 Tax=Gelidibacter maritimus TaxID=2761487 RepID=A0A7W2R317_9FLAO|nr:hypothetical protein [Gelidibacter maritimus]MBA6151525.1 hypothetical protein [Gelidibacter maritimus]
MKIIRVITFIWCGFGSSYAQQDLINTLQKQAITNDSLIKVIKNYEQSNNENQVTLRHLLDTINNLKSDLSKLKNLETEMNELEKFIKLKTDSIFILKSNITDKDVQLITQEQINIQKIKDVKENSKNVMITRVVDNYKNRNFEDLIKSSTLQSILNDKQILGPSKDIEPLLSDLEKYFSITKLFQSTFNNAKIKDAQNQFNQIQLESSSIDKLRNKVENYQALNDGLKETIEKIMTLDGQESVASMSKETQNKKLSKILIEISYYIFNYDINLLDYPYLSDVMFEIIKRKTPNPDADISDLLKKL